MADPELKTTEQTIVPIPKEVYEFIENQMDRYFKILRRNQQVSGCDDLWMKSQIVIDEWCKKRIEHLENMLLGGPIFIGKEQVK